MGEARRKRRLLEKANGKLDATRGALAESEVKAVEAKRNLDEAQRGLDQNRAEIDRITRHLQREIDDLCDRIGPTVLPKDDDAVAKFFVENDVETMDAETRDLRLAATIVPLIERQTDTCREVAAFLDTLDSEFVQVEDPLKLRLTAEIVAIVYARRLMTTSAETEGRFVPFKEMDFAKHMTPKSTVRHAKKALEAFLRAHEVGLSGPALKAKQKLDKVDPRVRLQIEKNLDADGKTRRDFELTRDNVMPAFETLYPEVLRHNRTAAFSKLFELIHADLLTASSFAGRELAVDVMAYILAERFVQDGIVNAFEETERGSHLFASKDGTKIKFNDTDPPLTGTAREAMLAFNELSYEDQIEFIKKAKNHSSENAPAAFAMVGDHESIQDAFDFAYGTILGEMSDEGIAKIATLMFVEEALLRKQRSATEDRERHSVSANGGISFGNLDKKPTPFLDHAQLWSDQELTRVGLSLWTNTYRLGACDQEVFVAAREVAKAWGKEARERGVKVNGSRENVVEAVVGWSAKWAVHAFQRIATSHTYAAALMCSDADRSILDDLEMQWHAFMVLVPDGILAYEDDRGVTVAYGRVLVASYDGAASFVLLNQDGGPSSHRIFVQIAENLADLLEIKEVEPIEAFETSDAELAATERARAQVQRIIVMAKRLVAGLLLALQNQDNFKSKTYPARENKKPREREEPTHRVVFVGSPLKIDCRKSVADYIRNGSPKKKGMPPQVQVLVRGHYKRQVVGVGRKGRKVIFIQPFWRGPEDAPILTRPKKLDAN